MSAALQLPPRRMTVPEFLEWSATVSGSWELRDGEPTLMNPPAVPHAALVGEIVLRIGTHLRTAGNRCRVYPGAGVSPRARADHNLLIPDVTVACDARNDRHAVHQPIALIEVLLPSNERDTRANVWAFTTIPSVVDILLVSSVDVGAELLTRDADGNWPERMLPVGANDAVVLRSIGFSMPLRELYSGTHLDCAVTGQHTDLQAPPTPFCGLRAGDKLQKPVRWVRFRLVPLRDTGMGDGYDVASVATLVGAAPPPTIILLFKVSDWIVRVHFPPDPISGRITKTNNEFDGQLIDDFLVHWPACFQQTIFL